MNGARIDTTFHHGRSLRRFLLLNLVALILMPFMLGSSDPKVDVVVRRDGEKKVLYRDGPYRNEGVQRRIQELTEIIRREGLEGFLSGVNPAVMQ